MHIHAYNMSFREAIKSFALFMQMHGYIYYCSMQVLKMKKKHPKICNSQKAYSVFKNILFYFIFREREREGDREGEKPHCVVASQAPPTGDLACNPGMCPDWESNWRPFGFQASTQCTEPHQPGLI